MSASQLLAQHPQLPYLAGAVAAGLIGLASLLRSLLTRRSLRRRIGSLALRLSDDPAAAEGHSLEAALSHLEHAAQRSLERSSEGEYRVSRLAGALDAVPVGVVVADEAGVVRFHNLRAAALLETAGDGRSTAELSDAVARLLASAGAGHPVARTIELAGPPPAVLNLRSVAIDDGQRPVGAMALIEDATEARRLEVVSRDFAANAGERLLRPVTAMAALARVLADGLGAGPVPPPGRCPGGESHLARRLADDAARLSGVVEDLVELARAERDQARRFERTPVAVVMDEAAAAVRPLARRRQVGLEVAPADMGCAVAGEGRSLVDALARLIENAVNHSGPGQSVTVDSVAVGNRVDLVVRDAGAGMDDPDLSRSFEAFYRGAGSGEPAGAGLGLTVARAVAHSHGGTVLVDSRPGEGTTAVIRLPLAAARLVS
ncbi:MAG TPA: PAS domain-containing sensor histidine kinase [Acidimicrobiales bacterium]|nr:PAS domain-containing sensor histidine kinase [Acidimicrobiales bacterium]